MAVIVEGKPIADHVPVVYRKAKVLPAGYRVMTALQKGFNIVRGAFLMITAGKLEAEVCRVGLIVAGGSTTAPRVKKGHGFVANNVVMLSGKKQSKTIQSVDTSNAEYDVLTLDAALTGADSGGILVEAKAAHDTAAVVKHEPNAFVDMDAEYKDADTVVSAAYDGILIAGNTIVPTEWVNGICLKGNPNVLIVAQ